MSLDAGFEIVNGVLNKYTGTATEVVIPRTVKKIARFAFCFKNIVYVSIPNTVEEIEYEAFGFCNSLKSVSVPPSVKKIDRNVFLGCKSLLSVTVDPANPFYFSSGNCIIEKLTKKLIVGHKNSVILADGSVTSIGSLAFSSDELKKIHIPASVTEICKDAFFYCSGIESITVDTNNSKYLGSGNCIIDKTSKTLVFGCKNSVIPTDGSVKAIGEGAFKSCGSLVKISIPSGVTSIGTEAFSSCKRLSEITIPSSVASIGDNAFYSCEKLERIELPKTLTSVGKWAFYGCGTLKEIFFPASLKKVGTWALCGCKSLAAINVARDNQSFLSSGNCLIERKSGTLVSGCKNSIIPNDGSVTRIGAAAFGFFHPSVDIAIPESVKVIEKQAFYYAKGISKLALPESVKEIGENAFENSGLKTILIPSSVSSIGVKAFDKCENLVVSCNKGSYAESYARDNKLKIEYIPEARGEMKSGTGKEGGVRENSPEVKAAATKASGEKPKTENAPEEKEKKPTDKRFKINGDTLLLYTGTEAAVTVPAEIKRIGANAFTGNATLRKITLPSGVEIIDRCAFVGCSKLEEVRTPDTLKSIGDAAFTSCRSLKWVYIHPSVTFIADSAFRGSESELTIVTTPKSFAAKYAKREEIAYSEDLPSTLRIKKSSPSKPNTPFVINNSILEKYNGNAIDVVVPLGVVGIGERAFSDNQYLGSVILPSSVKSISGNAFANCKRLKSIAIPSGLNSIGEAAFRGCVALTKITLPDGVASISKSAFLGCNNLTVTVTEGSLAHERILACEVAVNTLTPIFEVKDGVLVKYNGDEKLTGIQIPSGVVEIGAEVFKDNGNIKTVTIPDTVKIIGKEAFSGCDELYQVRFGSAVTEIGESAFHNCQSLVKIELGAAVREIGKLAFFACVGVRSVSFGKSLESVGLAFLAGCDELEKITVDAKNKKFASVGNCLIDKETKTLVAGCKTSVIPTDGSVTAIGDAAFYYNDGIENITIPNLVTVIGKIAFSHCSELRNVKFGKGLLAISEAAFSECESLDAAELPEALGTIDRDAFRGCEALAKAYVPFNVSFIGIDAFAGAPSLVMSVRKGSIAEGYARLEGIKYTVAD